MVSTARGTVILAHYGGIDEIAVFVVPVLLAILGLRWAEKKARHRAEREESRQHGD
ncbi:MAG TPA: hypothetical protein VE569_06930 [Acidimicrobiia bacterium]|jgi:hypothetical protein|nr:hypothetical protein [Acidimicrobiia bacterium]